MSDCAGKSGMRVQTANTRTKFLGLRHRSRTDFDYRQAERSAQKTKGGVEKAEVLWRAKVVDAPQHFGLHIG